MGAVLGKTAGEGNDHTDFQSMPTPTVANEYVGPSQLSSPVRHCSRHLILHIDEKPDVGIAPVHLRYDTGEIDTVQRIEFSGKGMMRAERSCDDSHGNETSKNGYCDSAVHWNCSLSNPRCFDFIPLARAPEEMLHVSRRICEKFKQG